MKRTPRPSRDTLERMYLEERMSICKISEKIGVVPRTIINWLSLYEIPVRTVSEAKLKGIVKPTREDLKLRYIEDQRSSVWIATEIGVNPSTIRRWLHEYGIQVRTNSESQLKEAVKPSKEELEHLYLKERLNTYEIRDKLGVATPSITRWLKEYGIPVRSNSEAKLKGTVKPSKEELKIMYLEDGLNAYEISVKLGVADVSIGNWLREYGIQVRTNSESQLKEAVKPTIEELKIMYLEEWLSSYKISEIIGVSNVTVCNWLNECGIAVRTNSDYSGENSNGWKGGLSFLPYCQKFNRVLKEKIRNRDNHTCQNCGVRENGTNLSIHHIHYDKENCYPDLIAVCQSCNAKANSNRDEWEALYMNKLNDRGLLHWTLSNVPTI